MVNNNNSIGATADIEESSGTSRDGKNICQKCGGKLLKERNEIALCMKCAVEDVVIAFAELDCAVIYAKEAMKELSSLIEEQKDKLLEEGDNSNLPERPFLKGN